MIMYKSPYRISLFGGGTDYTTFLEKHGIGMCIGFAIDKYSYVSARKLPQFFTYKTRLAYSQIELVNDNRNINHNGIRMAIEAFNMMDYPLEISHTSDLPTKTGLGTSSAFLVALSAALYDLKNDDKPLPTFLGAIASSIEQEYSVVGMQDHYFSAYGGCGELCFHADHKITYDRYNQDICDMLEANGLLFFTGIDRNASDVVGNYINKLADSKYQSRIFDVASKVSLAIARNKLTLARTGQYLRESWELKKSIDDSISNAKIDHLCDSCVDIGAYGVKLCGAGLGGTIYVLSETKFHDKIIDFCINNGCVHIPYKISEFGTTRVL